MANISFLAFTLLALSAAAETATAVQPADAAASAQGARRVDATAYRPPGKPLGGPAIVAVAGQPLEIRWPAEADAKPLAIQVVRLTGTRAVPVAAGATGTADGAHVWKWQPPVTRGPAHYEVRAAGRPEAIVHVETRDPQWFADAKKQVRHMNWQAAGLTAGERAALAKAGFRTAPGSRQTAGTASLEMISPDGAAGRRSVVWDANDHDLVVWRSGPADGDLSVRAPRWWISPDALATDEGLIRLLDLFFAVPPAP